MLKPKSLPRKTRCIIVEGLIGAGKTSLAEEIGVALGEMTQVLLEPADSKGNQNPYLDDYYKDPNRWAFPMQIFLLDQRYRMHMEAQWWVMSNYGDAVLDRSYFGDTAFARVQLKRGHMSQRDFETYMNMYHNMTSDVLLPNVCLRLVTSPQTSLRRIKHRQKERTGRACEVAIEIEYLEQLDEEIRYTVDVLRDRGVTTLDVPWDADRATAADRKDAVDGLVRSILATEPVDLWRDMHRRRM